MYQNWCLFNSRLKLNLVLFLALRVVNKYILLLLLTCKSNTQQCIYKLIYSLQQVAIILNMALVIQQNLQYKLAIMIHTYVQNFTII